MIENIGFGDRIIRVLLALSILVLYLSGAIQGVWALVLGLVAIVLAFTAVLGWCPLYMPLGISTRKRASMQH